MDDATTVPLHLAEHRIREYMDPPADDRGHALSRHVDVPRDAGRPEVERHSLSPDARLRRYTRVSPFSVK